MSENNTKTRRGMQLFEKNPYIADASVSTVQGTRRKTLKNDDGSQLMVTSADGSIAAPAGFWQAQEVDKTQFVKLYVNGVKAFRDLSSAGTRVFEILYLEVQKSIGRDRVYLSFAALPEGFSLSQATFTRGMRELMDKRFVAPTASIGWYWVNPDYMWNGDRLAYVKEYRLKRDLASDQAWREGLEARGQQRLVDPETGEVLS
jgi:hypothetical protein